MASKKKLQVFVSSTYLDLIKERQAAVEAILTSGHIPAGMELFSAGDKSQMEVIKRWIDESDVYLLLIGGRYGSVDPESDKSYTHLEYEYAINTGKPFFALMITEKHLDEKVKGEGKDVLELDHPQKLRDFKALIKTKIVKFWDDPRDIKLAILQKLPEFERRPELTGWIPGNEAINPGIIAKEVVRLTEENYISKHKESFRSSVNNALEELDQKRHAKGLAGVPSGFYSLDRVTAGWHPSELIILASRPGMGKTSFILSILRNAAIKFRLPTAIFSLEMSSKQLLDRLISAEAEIDSEKIRKGNLTSYEWAQLHFKIPVLQEAPIFVRDPLTLSISELRAECIQLKAQNNIQLVLIDHLQLISGYKTGGSSNNHEQETASILRALKNLARELDLPIIVLSQLSKAIEARGGEKRPQLSDLRESVPDEHHADMVLFLYRPEYYGITEDEMGNSVVGIGEVSVAKNRNGPLDIVQLRFLGKYTKFVDLYDYSKHENEDSTRKVFEFRSDDEEPPF